MLTEAWVPLRFLRVWVLEQMLLFCLMYHRIILQEIHAILIMHRYEDMLCAINYSTTKIVLDNR